MEKEPTFGDFTASLGLGWALVFSVASIVFVVLAVLPSDSIPLTYVRIGAGLLAIIGLWIAAFIVWRRERVARRVAERKLDSTFSFDLSNPHALLKEGDAWVQRINVKNVGGVDGVERVTVKLNDISPCPESLQGRLADVLEPMLLFGQFASDPFHMNAGDAAQVNVFTYAPNHACFVLWTTNPRLDKRLEVRDYEIELIASGSPAKSETRRFRIGVANERPFIRFA